MPGCSVRTGSRSIGRASPPPIPRTGTRRTRRWRCRASTGAQPTRAGSSSMGGSGPRIDRGLSALGAENFFECGVCCEDVRSRKPDPAPLLLALERIGVQPAAAAYVGDSPEDILMARAAGAFALGIEGGFPNREALRASNPDLLAVDLVSAIDELLV